MNDDILLPRRSGVALPNIPGTVGGSDVQDIGRPLVGSITCDTSVRASWQLVGIALLIMM